MTTTRKPSTAKSLGTVAVAASVALWLAGSTMSPVTAISEGSSLQWGAKPATANPGVVITSVVGNPSGPRVKAVLYNGSGVQERIAGIPIELEIVHGPQCLRAGTGRAETNANGVAIFEPIIDCEFIGYQMQARAADGASLNSGHIAETSPATFDIRQGDLTVCSGTCSDGTSDGGTQVQVTADVTGYLVLDLGGGTLTCDGYTTSSRIATFDVRGDDEGRTTVVITLDKSQVTRSFKKYEVCLQKLDDSGDPAGPAEQLPDCPETVTLGTDNCVLSRKREQGDVRVAISVKPEDPRVAL